MTKGWFELELDFKVTGNEFEEDCTWKDPSTGKDVPTVVTPAPSGTPVQCVGGAWPQVASGTDARKKPVPPGSKPSASPCEWEYFDSPFKDMGFLEDWAVAWEFVGVIFDRCHNWEIRRVGYLSWKSTNSPKLFRKGGGKSHQPEGTDTAAPGKLAPIGAAPSGWVPWRPPGK